VTQLSINGLALLLALVALWGASRGPLPGEYTRCACPVQGHARHGRHAAMRGGEPGPVSHQRSSRCGALALCGARAPSLTGARASLEELRFLWKETLVGK
jgi:hypothetical protein